MIYVYDFGKIAYIFLVFLLAVHFLEPEIFMTEVKKQIHNN